MADCELVAKSEEYKRILDDKDLTSWIVCNIEGYSQLVVDSAGEGGYDECVKHLDPKRCQFALIEVLGLENKSAITSRRTKFIFIAWIGSETPIIDRAKVSTISSQVRQFFARAHIGFQVNTLEEMTKELIIKELDRASGCHSPDEYIFDITAEDLDFSSGQNEIIQEGNNNFDDLWDEFKKQESSINWILFQLAKDENLLVFNHGNNGFVEMYDNLDENEVLYGIFKVTAYNKAGSCTSVRERFVFLSWVPECTSVFARARVATHKQVLLKRLQTYHADIRAETKEDITRESIIDLLDRSCGSHRPQKYIFGPDDEVITQEE